MMEIIDKRHAEFVDLNGKKSNTSTISFNTRNVIYFSKRAVKQFELKENLCIHFVVEVDRVYIYINSDLSGLRLHHAHGGALQVKGGSILAILKDRFPSKIKTPSKFLLRECLTKINESKTLEILLNKRA